MLANEESTVQFDYVARRVIQQGQLTLALGAVQIFELTLPACSLKVYRVNQENLEPLLEIAQNIGDPRFQLAGADRVFGFRSVYRGGPHCLYEVALQRLYASDADTRPLLPSELLQRSHELTDGRELTPDDMQQFNAFLKYAARFLETTSH